MKNKRLCVALSMHHLLIIIAIASEKRIPLTEFHYFILRSGADYTSLIKAIFPNAKVHIIPKFMSKKVFDRAAEIRSAALDAIRELNISSEAIEAWIPNKTYHITNFLFYHSNIINTIGYEDGAGAYTDSGLLEWKAGLRIAAKKILSIVLFFPAYTSFRGVAQFCASEYWSLSSSALFPRRANIISNRNYRNAIEQAVLYTPPDRWPDTNAFPEGPYLVIAGQPLSEGGWCSNEQSIGVFEELATKFSKANVSLNFIFYIPHPAESHELANRRLEHFVAKLARPKLSYQIHPNRLSIELFINSLASRGFEIHLVSTLSTALYTTKLSSTLVRSYYFGSSLVPHFDSLKEAFSDFGVIDIDEISRD